MEWRCTWCGKPHAADDPPCDNCGHNKFERAVEQVNTETVPSDPIWVCTECGRQHQKNSPPCSRCGNVTLEQRQPDYDLEELGGTSYLDVLEPKYVAGYVAVAILGGILLLSYVGVISLPTLGGIPGEGQQVGNVSLADVETEYVAALDATVPASLAADDGLGRGATVFNERLARARYDRGAEPPTAAGVREDVDLPCESAQFHPYLVQLDRPVERYDAAGLAAAAMPTGESPARRAVEQLDEGEPARVGVDVRVEPRSDDAPDRLLVTLAEC